MAAFGAAASLKNTILCILQSSRISLVPPSPQILQPAYYKMENLQIILLKLDDTGYSMIRTKVNALDERIKEAIWEFEDLLESRFYDQILPQLESERDHLSFSVDLQSLRQSVDRFVKRVIVMETEFILELMDMPEEEGEPISSRIDFSSIGSKMVGLSDQFERLRDYLVEDEGDWISVIGMAGVGKTTLAKKVFDDPSIRRHFELRAWVKVGRKCEFNEILRCILAQVDPSTRDQMLTQGEDDDDDEELLGVLEERLKDKNCLIVLDDLWEWDTLVMDNLPKGKVRILLTSRLANDNSPVLRVRLLNEEESKKLLAEKVFREDGFPPHLNKLGEEIAYKCEGLPLIIVTVAELLSREEKTTEYWTEVVKKQYNSVFVNAYDQISEVLFPSYDYLPQFLKMFFLYVGAFPPYKNIDMHYLFHQLSGDGFIAPMGIQSFEKYMAEYLAMLSKWFNLVLLDEFGQLSWFSMNTFRVHSCWQHVCKKEASKIKFLHVLHSCEDVLEDQRRLCAHSNSLFAFKEVNDSIRNDCAHIARSLLCLGPYHQYPMPIHAMDFKLLRVLDALHVRFYHIPLEILKLVCLKYLALTCNCELPVSISNLLQLQILIIHPHIYIIRCGAMVYMPMEIWDMQELRLIHVVGRDLPTPDSDATLAKLSSLIGVSVKSCTREILKRIPNLKILVIRMELKPYDDDDDVNQLSGLDYISEELRKLEALSYAVMNPKMKYECLVPLSMFPSSLTSLQLSGLRCPWKHMNDIGLLLPNLVTLKLEHYAFQGPYWDIESQCFLKLDTLIIEDTDLVRWRSQHGSLPMLGILSIRHCYKLQQLVWTSDSSMATTRTIELVECNPLIATTAYAMQLRPESLFIVRWYTSFEMSFRS